MRIKLQRSFDDLGTGFCLALCLIDACAEANDMYYSVAEAHFWITEGLRLGHLKKDGFVNDASGFTSIFGRRKLLSYDFVKEAPTDTPALRRYALGSKTHFVRCIGDTLLYDPSPGYVESHRLVCDQVRVPRWG